MSLPFVLGVIGLVLCCSGVPMKQGMRQAVVNVSGISLLTLMVLLDWVLYFVALEIVALIAGLLAFTQLEQSRKAQITLVCGVIAVGALVVLGEIGGVQDIVGLVGLLGLSLGFATQLPLWKLVGGAGISFYSAVDVWHNWGLGVLQPSLYVPLLFCVLNVLFSMLALFEFAKPDNQKGGKRHAIPAA